MLLTIDLTNDIVTVYSPNIQRYKVYAVGNFYYESNAQVQEYKFIDQDGDSGTLKLVMRTTGRSEVYIQFANIIWAYIVVRN